MDRNPENDDKARKAFALQTIEDVKAWKKHWKYAFDRMRQDQGFARGRQWSDDEPDISDDDREYQANITLRHVKSKTDEIYAKNPSFVYRRREKRMTKFWDGTPQSLQIALSTPTDQKSQIIIQEAMGLEQYNLSMDNVGHTMRLALEYFISEQQFNFKRMMKKQVRRALTVGVAYTRLDFQRIMRPDPDVERQIADSRSMLDGIERISEDLADGEVNKDEPEAARLRLLIQNLEQRPQLVLREGLAFDYPSSTSIIPDTGLSFLGEFAGCDAVAQEFMLHPDRIKEIYGVDVSKHFTPYRVDKKSRSEEPITARHSARKDDLACVWEVWNKRDGMVYTVCDGFEDFLMEPAEPDVQTDHFYPWYPLAFNWCEDDEDPFPPSDVRLMSDQQMEINRSGEGRRQHRIAARPGYVAAGGMMSDKDVKKLRSRVAHTIVELSGLQPGQDVREYLQSMPTSPIDPQLYETSQAFTDILRSVGSQEANLGGTSGATATESSIAEGSRRVTATSDTDEIDDHLTAIAHAAGQIMLHEMNEEAIKEIVGPMAVWPDQDRDQISRDLLLEVEAGSSGRPNQALEMQKIERLYPLLFQIPGIATAPLAKLALQNLAPNLRMEDVVDVGGMSIMAINGAAQANANGGGANNAQRPPQRGPGGPAGPGQA
jgi:hypothetical protein